MNDYKYEWDMSYINKDNFVFYPHEEIIRFVSKYIRKRVDLNNFKDVCNIENPKMLDVGCGIGRHIIYAADMGIEAFGIDLSENAIRKAREWAAKSGLVDSEKRIIQGDIRNLPWTEETFDFAISHGVLDSMTFSTAKEAVKEIARVLKEGGLFYCDIISGDDSSHFREYAGEELVKAPHECGTIQSYFNFTKINELIHGVFAVKESFLIRKENILTGQFTSRYHLVLKKM
ncbi:methyltransferase type 11 [Lucifera butyrica]|uniref:Methyltransferase type 11 n=1 Tax=Lucifera butyrica TaxID=1351585 RepID=A0A498R2Z0_9FIRM|nr:class I SAM-dependent methyltransferase [Lucifera butyrica]VBB05539.1 methyltransferase type 11 [Lucifera butyrica]